MPMSTDEKILARAYLRRKMVTFPFFVIMIAAIFPFLTNGVQWAKGHFGWSQVDAEVMVVSDDIIYFRYLTARNDNAYHTGSVPKQKVLWCIPFGHSPHEYDSIKVAYNPSKPTEYIVYTKLYCKLITWGFIGIMSFLLYSDLEERMKEHIRKTTNIRLTG